MDIVVRRFRVFVLLNFLRNSFPHFFTKHPQKNVRRISQAELSAREPREVCAHTPITSHATMSRFRQKFHFAPGALHRSPRPFFPTLPNPLNENEPPHEQLLRPLHQHSLHSYNRRLRPSPKILQPHIDVAFSLCVSSPRH